MIHPLRQRHRRMFAVLGVLLPLAFGVGIAARRTVPATLPPELWTQTFTATDYERGDLFAKSPIRVRLWHEQGTGRFAVGFSAAKDFLKPDLLAYWSAEHPTSDTLPPEARLLGAFVAGPLVLPADVSGTDGYLILFSLANQEIVDVSKPFGRANSERGTAAETERGSMTSMTRSTSERSEISSTAELLRLTEPRSEN